MKAFGILFLVWALFGLPSFATPMLQLSTEQVDHLGAIRDDPAQVGLKRTLYYNEGNQHFFAGCPGSFDFPLAYKRHILFTREITDYTLTRQVKIQKLPNYLASSDSIEFTPTFAANTFTVSIPVGL